MQRRACARVCTRLISRGLWSSPRAVRRVSHRGPHCRDHTTGTTLQGTTLRGTTLQGPHCRGPHYSGPPHRRPNCTGPHSRGPHHEGPNHSGPHHRGPHCRGPHHSGPHHGTSPSSVPPSAGGGKSCGLGRSFNRDTSRKLLFGLDRTRATPSLVQGTYVYSDGSCCSD